MPDDRPVSPEERLRAAMAQLIERVEGAAKPRSGLTREAEVRAALAEAHAALSTPAGPGTGWSAYDECSICGAPAGYPCNAPAEGEWSDEPCAHRPTRPPSSREEAGRDCDSCGGDGLTYSPDHEAHFCPRCFARANPSREEAVPDDEKFGAHLREVVDHVRSLPDSEQRTQAVQAREASREEAVEAAAKALCDQGIVALDGTTATWERHADGFRDLARAALSAARPPSP